MDKLFLTAFKFTKANEGSFSDRPGDRGGKTLFGVTVFYYPIQYWRAWRAWKAGKTEELERILLNFYYSEFWNTKYEQLLDKKLAIRLYDLSVNLGKKTAIKLLQQAIDKSCDKNISIDGKFGNQTLGLCNFLYKEISADEEPLYEEFIDRAERYYRSRPDFSKNPGWLNRLNRDINVFDLT